MVSKNDFAPLEWKKLIQAPLLAGFAVSAADTSSFIGALQESFASAKMMADAKDETGNYLIKEIAAELMTSNGRADAREGIRTIFQGAQSGDLKERALEALKEIVTIVDTKSPENSIKFKDWLNKMAVAVAEAGTEGGFLGFGGVKVSDAEKATLAEIAAILGE